MEDEWLLKARPDRVKDALNLLLVRTHYSVLCARALSITHPITFGHKVDHIKHIKTLFSNVRSTEGSCTHLCHPGCHPRAASFLYLIKFLNLCENYGQVG